MTADTTYRDRELFVRIARGDEEAFKTIFDTYYLPFVTYAARLLNSDLWAEEMVQDVFLKLWTIRETLPTIENPGGFLNRLVFNRIRNHLKHKNIEYRVQHYLSRLARERVDHATLDRFDYRLGEQLFARAIEQLPAQRARVFRMRHEQGMSREQIASALNISKNTVRNLLNLAVQNVRAYLLEHGDIDNILSSAVILLLSFF